MATHEQTHLGQVFDSMQDDGLIVFDESENSYGLAAEFVQRATALGVVIDAEPACSHCNGDHPDHIHEEDAHDLGVCVKCLRRMPA